MKDRYFAALIWSFLLLGVLCPSIDSKVGTADSSPFSIDHKVKLISVSPPSGSQVASSTILQLTFDYPVIVVNKGAIGHDEEWSLPVEEWSVPVAETLNIIWFNTDFSVGTDSLLYSLFKSVWKDDFQDVGTDEWEIYQADPEIEKWWVEEGVAVGEIFQPGYVSLWMTGTEDWSDYSVSLRARLEQEDNEHLSSFGLTMYSSDNNVSAYQFLLIRNGTATIAKSSSSALPLEYPFEVEVGTWYDLEASIKENRIEFHINGQPVGVAVDEDILTAGRVGLVVSNARVQFDDVEITGDGIPHGGPGNNYVVDQEAPTIVSASILDGAIDVDPITIQHSGISFEFSEEINFGNIELKPINGDVLGVESEWESQKVTMTLLADETLDYGTSYQVNISGVSDKVGNLLSGHLITFTTMEQETIAPKITGGNITNGDTSVDPIYFSDPQTGITLEFSEDILSGSLELKSVDGELLVTEAQWEQKRVTITLLAGKTLVFGTSYLILLTNVTDLVGNPLENEQIAFTTSSLSQSYTWSSTITITSNNWAYGILVRSSKNSSLGSIGEKPFIRSYAHSNKVKNGGFSMSGILRRIIFLPSKSCIFNSFNMPKRLGGNHSFICLSVTFSSSTSPITELNRITRIGNICSITTRAIWISSEQPPTINPSEAISKKSE